jgi:hypothetical protein
MTANESVTPQATAVSMSTASEEPASELADNKNIIEPVGTIFDNQSNKEDQPQEKTKTGRRRKERGNDEAYLSAYQGLQYRKITPTGRPASPHSYFTESYQVETIPPCADKDIESSLTGVNQAVSDTLNAQDGNGNADIDTQFTTSDRQNTMNKPQSSSHNESDSKSPTIIYPILRHHANGLVVVTSDQLLNLTNESTTTTLSIAGFGESNIDNPDHDTDNGDVMHSKKKRKQKDAHSTTNDEKPGGEPKSNTLLSPQEVILRQSTPSSSVALVCGVWGTLIEVNSAWQATTKASESLPFVPLDPLLDGYIAIILPRGPFPPPTQIMEATDQTVTDMST